MFAGVRARAICATAALALTYGGLLMPGPAHAGTALLTCTGTQTVTYHPPLTNTPTSTTVEIRETYTSCLDTAGIASGTGSFSLTETASCTSVNDPLGPPDRPVYDWNTHQKSGVTFTVTSVDRLGNGTTQVTAAGTVSSGFGEGSKAIRTATLPDLSLAACAGSGVRQQSGPATLTLL
ncbi:hypothetical protein AB0C96_09975 [Streptomyces sp. NPDC048506]|uniref:hypothetical protein n=1 Tax=Streptomyces sp. NPDC048506 TaxID=3155028 RepID=UPI00343A3C98